LNAQRLDLNYFSGILRIDVGQKTRQHRTNPHSGIPTDGSGHAFYSIPPDNPFLGVTDLYGMPVNQATLRGEFYAIGFRHPWRFSVDPATGEIWVGDVGQDRWEEIEILRKGGTMGGRTTRQPTLPRPIIRPSRPCSASCGLRDGPPLWEYHTQQFPGADPKFSGPGCQRSLVYHGSRIAALTNAYLFGDFRRRRDIILKWALSELN